MNKAAHIVLLLVLAGCTSDNFDSVTSSVGSVPARPAPIAPVVTSYAKPAPVGAVVAKPVTKKPKPVRTASIRPPRFGDSDPVEFAGGSPRAYGIHGVDVSKYQGDINWKAVRRGGMSFAFIKATEGGDHKDDSFRTNWHAARKAGVLRGAYHFYYFCTSASAQARWFIRNVPKDKNALPPVLDMEWNPGSRTCKKRPDPAKVARSMQVFLTRVERHYGKRPIIYTTPDFYDDNLKGRFKKYPIWLRTVKEHPRRRYPGRKWVFWQYTGTGRAPGFSTNVDINVFNGNNAAWQRWVKSVR